MSILLLQEVDLLGAAAVELNGYVGHRKLLKACSLRSKYCEDPYGRKRMRKYRHRR
jgi:hypothetical protein